MNECIGPARRSAQLAGRPRWIEGAQRNTTVAAKPRGAPGAREDLVLQGAGETRGATGSGSAFGQRAHRQKASRIVDVRVLHGSRTRSGLGWVA